MANIIRIPPYHYIHIQDTNTNTLSLITGPRIYVRQDHETLKSGSSPAQMTRLPPRHYAIILNPVIRAEDGTLVTDKYGQASLRRGDLQIRFQQDYPQPYALYPGQVCKKIEQLQVVAHDCALMIEAQRNYTDAQGNQRQPGDRWYFFGPGTYRPRIQEMIVKRVKSVVIKTNQALRLRAERELTDSTGEKRKAGEEWLVRTTGSYLAGVYQENIKTQNAFILTNSNAIMLRASRGFTDVYGKPRKAGQEWLVTVQMSDSHILDIYEEFERDVPLTILTKNQYCVVVDPWDFETGSNRFGYRVLKVGQDSFFLMPGESLEGGIKNKYVLLDDQALLLRANESIEIEGQEKKPGDRWMIHGPCKYIPPTEVEILEVRKAIPLHVNEGIYVRDIRSGVVRAEFGKTYMLKAHQELWEMQLSDTVEDLLGKGGWRRSDNKGPSISSRPDKSRVVSFRVQSNAAVQIYDYKQKQSRVVAGPNLVHLLPDQQFTVSVLSGGKPKRVGVIQSLFLTLGPDFSTDIIEVDTSDHARLRIQLSYNWRFGIEDEVYEKVFKVRDFVGNLCNFMAAKVREAVAIHTFEQFHKTSARIIRKSIFGLDEEGRIKDNFVFPDNNLYVTNVDIQSIEPVDRNTRERLRESVTLAIEITARSQEDKARHVAQIQAQEAQGIIQKLGIENLAKVEEEKVKLYQLQGESESVQNEGLALAHAKAKAEANKVKFQSEVDEAQLRTQAERLIKENDISHIKLKQQLEIEQQKRMDEVEIEKARNLAEIESEKFKKTIGSIGSETLVAISEAGPKTQAELLEGLGLQGYMLMDTNNPVNLFNTAQGMLSQLPQNNQIL